MNSQMDGEMDGDVLYTMHTQGEPALMTFAAGSSDPPYGSNRQLASSAWTANNFLETRYCPISRINGSLMVPSFPPLFRS